MSNSLANAFTNKVIELHITLASGTFSGGNTKIVAGLATSVNIIKPGLPDKNRATVTVYGMLPEDMDELTMLAFRPREARNNRIAILAGDGKSLSQVFAGEIREASADYNAAPDIPFTIEASSGYYPSLIPTQAFSFKGDIAVADVISSIAADIGYTFTAKNATAKLLNPVLGGTALEKALLAAKQADLNLLVDDGGLILLPHGEARPGGAVRIASDTGMIGYPAFSDKGISLKTYYNPAVTYNGLIEVDSVVRKARGIWRVTKLSHNLSAFQPGGAWQSEIEAVPAE